MTIDSALITIRMLAGYEINHAVKYRGDTAPNAKIVSDTTVNINVNNSFYDDNWVAVDIGTSSIAWAADAVFAGSISLPNTWCGIFNLTKVRDCNIKFSTKGMDSLGSCNDSEDVVFDYDFNPDIPVGIGIGSRSVHVDIINIPATAGSGFYVSNRHSTIEWCTARGEVGAHALRVSYGGHCLLRYSDFRIE